MNKTTLHYIYDPLCGWCYGAAPLVEAALKIDGLQIELHGGGLMSARQVTPEFRRHVMPHDQQIERLTGQPFGPAYRDGLLLNTTLILDSAPPIAAILAAIKCGADGCEMLQAIQRAYYVEGRYIVEKQVLSAVAQDLGIRAGQFEAALKQQESEKVEAHILASRRKLASTNSGGFPTFLLEKEHSLTRLEASQYYGQTVAWSQRLRSAALPSTAGNDR